MADQIGHHQAWHRDYISWNTTAWQMLNWIQQPLSHSAMTSTKTDDHLSACKYSKIGTMACKSVTILNYCLICRLPCCWSTAAITWTLMPLNLGNCSVRGKRYISLHCLKNHKRSMGCRECSPILVNRLARVKLVVLSACQVITHSNIDPETLYSVSSSILTIVQHKPYQVVFAYSSPRSV